MKKVYNEIQLIKVGKIDTDATSFRRHYVYIDEEEAKEYIFTIETFQQLCNLVEKDYIHNASIRKALFSNKNIVNLTIGLQEIEVTEKDFTPIKVGFSYVECEKATLTNLMNRLPADVFLEYLKDRGFKEINF